MRDSVLVTSISAMPMTVRIASTRIAITSAAPRSPLLIAFIGLLIAFIGVVAQVDAERLEPPAVPREAGIRALVDPGVRRVYDLDPGRGLGLVLRIGDGGFGVERCSHARTHRDVTSLLNSQR